MRGTSPRATTDGVSTSAVFSVVRRATAALVWLAGLGFSLVVALMVGRPWGQRLGTSLASHGWLTLELGLGLGSVFGMAVASAGIQVLATGTAAVLRGRLPQRPLALSTIAHALRRDVAVSLWWGLHTFPASALYVVALPVMRSARLRLAERHPLVARALAGLYVVGFATFLFALVRWAPFLNGAETTFFVVFAAGLLAALGVARERRFEVLLAASVVLALYLTLDPPQAVEFPPRLAVAAGLVLLGAGPALLAGRAGCRELGVIGPAAGLVVLGLWAWWGEFLLFPSTGDAARVAAQPGVSVLYRNGSGGAWSDNRFLMEACDPDRIIYGSREIAHGIVRIAPGGKVSGTLAIHTGYNLVTDCQQGIGYVGNYSGGEIDRIDLATLSMLAPVPRVEIGGPTLLQLSPDAKHLYAIDDSTGDVRRIALDTGGVDVELQECLPNGFFADESLGRIYLASCGRFDLYGAQGGEPLSQIGLRRGLVPPFPFGCHFHRLTGDPERGKAFVSYLDTGRVYRVDGRTGALEAEAHVGYGVRDLTWDARNRILWVSNYVSGELLAVDPDSLAVRGHVQVGRRIRSIEPSLDGRRVYVT